MVTRIVSYDFHCGDKAYRFNIIRFLFISQKTPQHFDQIGVEQRLKKRHVLPCASTAACTSPAPVYTPGTRGGQLVWSVDRACGGQMGYGAAEVQDRGQISPTQLEEGIAVDKRQD